MGELTAGRLVVQVTDDDIRDGVRSSCTDCPVARAIMRAVGWGYCERRIVKVGMTCITFTAPGLFIIMPSPLAVCEFIRAFDMKRRVREMEFLLPLTDEQIGILERAA